MRQLLPLLIGALFLTGCERVVSDACPAPREYTAEFQERAANELDALPDGSAILVLIADYGVTREQLRACR